MKILLVGTNRPCHRTLADAGHEVVLAVETSKILPGDRDNYAAVVPLTEASPRTGGTAGLDLADASLSGVEVVAAYHDSYYETAAALAEALGARCSVDPAVTRITRDKSLTREHTAALDCGRVRSTLVGAGTPPAAVEDVEMPCVVKPLDAEASLGVTFVTKPDRLADAVRVAQEADRQGRCLVEEMITGPEVSVETFSIGGHHHVLAVTEKFKIPGSPVEQGHLVPARLPAKDHDRTAAAAREVLDAVGLKEGPGHTEFILSPSGPKLVECHNRMGGDRIGTLVELATGVDYTALVARHGALLPVGPYEVRALGQRRAAVWYSDAEPASDAATVSAVDGEEAAASVEHVERIEVLKKPGASVSRIRGSFDRPALAIASADTADAALESAQNAVSHLSFTYHV
ncbi:hypothetical protein SMCF_7387 [Streptomyces coelicoflavus ZG0656]|nr:hypothetical protein SMCF_7387 [Streptomyces coelicoflavus ZG0656]MZE49246.1 ATP-grasp domain-containing protein [Streptomyces sp. SID5477]